jgi:hypothetical protein
MDQFVGDHGLQLCRAKPTSDAGGQQQHGAEYSENAWLYAGIGQQHWER